MLKSKYLDEYLKTVPRFAFSVIQHHFNLQTIFNNLITLTHYLSFLSDECLGNLIKGLYLICRSKVTKNVLYFHYSNIHMDHFKSVLSKLSNSFQYSFIILCFIFLTLNTSSYFIHKFI